MQKKRNRNCKIKRKWSKNIVEACSFVLDDGSLIFQLGFFIRCPIIDVGNIGVGFRSPFAQTGCNTHPLLIRMESSHWSAPTRPTEDNFSTAHFGQQNFTLERKRTCLNDKIYFRTI